MTGARVYFEDDDFLDLLTSLLLTDRTFLKQYGEYIQGDDLKPRSGSPQANDRWLVATKALEYWKVRFDPIGKQALTEFRAHAKLARFDEHRLKQGHKYIQGLLTAKASPSAIGEKVVEFRSQTLKASAIDELLELQSTGQLSDTKWNEVVRKGQITNGFEHRESDYYQTLDARIQRRAAQQTTRYPALFIAPLDRMVRAIARGQFGLVYGPWKRGKSQLLRWIALAYTIQELSVAYWTLEDPLQDVEDGLDAAVSALPIKNLRELPNRLKSRFRMFRRLTSDKLKIIDRTGGGATMLSLEHDFLRMREEGFKPDACIFDYDDEIIPEKKLAERRFETAEIYRHMRQFASRYEQIVWTGAQTAADSLGNKQLGGEHLAEDRGKLRKVSFALGMGRSDWGDDGVFLWVGAHKNDRQFLGCNVMTDRERGLIYSPEKTAAMERKQVKQQGKKKA